MKILRLVLVFVLIQMLMAVNVAAYLDPSAMTYLIQIVAGVAVAGGAALTIYWKKIRLALKKRKNKKIKKEE